MKETRKDLIKFETSLLFVKDINTSKNFYSKVLGQEILMDFGKCITFKGGFAIMDADHLHDVIFNEKKRVTVNKNSNNFELYFETEEIHKVYDIVKIENIEFIHNIREQPWGQLVFRFFDYDVYIIEIGESTYCFINRMYKEGLESEKIAEKTGIPLDQIKKIIDPSL